MLLVRLVYQRGVLLFGFLFAASVHRLPHLAPLLHLVLGLFRLFKGNYLLLIGSLSLGGLILALFVIHNFQALSAFLDLLRAPCLLHLFLRRSPALLCVCSGFTPAVPLFYR